MWTDSIINEFGYINWRKYRLLYKKENDVKIICADVSRQTVDNKLQLVLRKMAKYIKSLGMFCGDRGIFWIATPSKHW